MEGDPLLNLTQAHEFLQVSEKTLRNYCKAGKVVFHQEKNLRGVMEYRFRKADLEDFARRRAARESAGNSRTQRNSTMPARGSSNVDNNAASGVLQQAVLPPSLAGAQHAEAAWRECSEWAQALVSQLQAEVLFLKEQLQEKDRQLAARDKQLDRQLERLGALNEQLATLAVQRGNTS